MICIRLDRAHIHGDASQHQEHFNEFFAWLWDQGVVSFWCDNSQSMQTMLGFALARLGRDVDDAKVYVDLPTSESLNVFDVLTYIDDSFDRLKIGSVDALMADIRDKSPAKAWRDRAQIANEIVRRKMAYGLGVVVSKPQHVDEAVKMRIQRPKPYQIAMPAVATADGKAIMKAVGADLLVMIDEHTSDEMIGQAFASGCELCVGAFKPEAFVRKIVEGYMVKDAG